MELKSYQKKVIEDLAEYFQYLQKYKSPAKAFNNFWQEKSGTDSLSLPGDPRYYQDNIENTVHLCIKVPTAGGKTFIACNALKTIFNQLPPERPKAVVWLVPWSNLLDQTVKNLSDREHPYCQKLNSLFNNRVSIIEKQDLLFGTGFNPSTVKENLTIMVMNYASIRAKNKDDRKIYDQNSSLAVFAHGITKTSHVLPDSDETSLINVIRGLNPVLIVDESHNAESPLSVEMLRNLNPSFILDLTATPKDNANIISLVPAIELKKEHMVKLPVIVFNHQDKEGVVESALHLREKLQKLADKQTENGGKYIRPIVLFQAQSKTKEDNTTFEKLKKQLIEVGIPESEIKIKTAGKDELKGLDLMSRDCTVKYIITINALKEGWDCPFAYILASLADRSSEVDVTQILGRVLRQPYVMKHADPMLNLSYVITASAKFNETLQSIIKGLKESGFSEKDYRQKNEMPLEISEETKESFVPQSALIEMKFDARRITFDTQSDHIPASVQTIEALAIEENKQMEKQIAELGENDSTAEIFQDMGIKIKKYEMREAVAELARSIKLPKFIIARPPLLFKEQDYELLDRANLMDGFRLSELDIKIDFESVSSDLYKIDLEEMNSNEYRMSPFKIENENDEFYNRLIESILMKPREAQIKDLSYQAIRHLGKMNPISETEIEKYVTRVLENMNSERLRDFAYKRFSYSDKIKQRINELADIHAEKKFQEWLVINKISAVPHWNFPTAIIPGATADEIGNSLYSREGEMNGLEKQFALSISGCSNIAFWHRNLGKGKGYSLNGSRSNHYPDFIIVTKKGTVILAETKGSDRDNPDSISKRKLGKAWSELSGPAYKYMMIFDKNPPEGAYSLEKAKELIMQM
ncbi:MAG TPA: DEAD/DEAH box helicase family protein [Bacteroidia bacterium]|jgi:type III restriction enzyme